MTNQIKNVTCAQQLESLIDTLSDHLFEKHNALFDEYYLNEFDERGNYTPVDRDLWDDYAKEYFQEKH